MFEGFMELTSAFLNSVADFTLSSHFSDQVNSIDKFSPYFKTEEFPVQIQFENLNFKNLQAQYRLASSTRIQEKIAVSIILDSFNE